MAMRIARIWPCHIAVIVLILLVNGQPVVTWYATHYATGEVLAAIFLLQSWFPDLRVQYALNAPSWSLSAELFFYAMFPLLSRIAVASPVRVLLTGFGLSLAWVACVAAYSGNVDPALDLPALLVGNPLSRIAEFAAGIATCEWVARRKAMPRPDGMSALLIEAAALLLVIVFCAYTNPIMDAVWVVAGPIAGMWVGKSAPVAAFAFLIAVLAISRGPLARFLAAKPLTWLGETSFALYLVHQPMIFYLKSHAPWFRMLPKVVQIILFLVVLLALVAGLHHGVERPAMQWMRNRLARRRTRQNAVA